MSPAMHFLAWNALEIYRGERDGKHQKWTRLDLDWQPGDIRNCSYSAPRQWIGISAEDRTNGRHVIAVHEVSTGISRILLRVNYVLGHSLSPAGSQICYLQPSVSRGSADLCLYDISAGTTRVLASGVAAQSTTPVWFADGARIAYHSPDGWLEVIDVAEGLRTRLTAGEVPAISWTEDWIAFQRENQIWVKKPAETERSIYPSQRRVRRKSLTDGLSWSKDGRYLSFGALTGLVDKETAFYLLEVANGEVLKIQSRYLRSLLILD